MPWPAELAQRTVPVRWPKLFRPRAPRSPRRPAPPAVRHLRDLVSCEAVSEELPLVVDGTRHPSDAMAEHIQTCLACQAELAGYRRLLRVLRALRNDPVAFPTDAQGAMSALQDLLSRRPRGPAPGVPGPGSQDWPTLPWLVAAAWAALGVIAFGAGALVARAGIARASR
jgi:hypothetical protein